ncbi:UNVERIFIED_CONTAM: competence protein ComEC [Brevibacillus sp. OAP136]
MGQKNVWFSCGLTVAAGYVLSASLAFKLVISLYLVLLTLCLFVPKQYAKKIVCLLMIGLIASSYYAYYDFVHRSFLQAAAEREERLYVWGSIDSQVKRDGDILQFYLLAERVGKTEATLEQPARPERIAVRVRLTEEGQIQLVEHYRQTDRLGLSLDFAMPQHARNPHAFDYAAYLSTQGVTVTGSGTFADIVAYRQEATVQRLFQEWQEQAAKRVAQCFSDPIAAGYLQSLLFGVQEAPDPSLVELYRDMGLIHVLAISGLHVTLVSMFCMQALKMCRLQEKHAFLLTSILIGGYVMLVGASPSAIRAGVMGALYLWGRLLDKRWSGLELLGAALLGMLIVSPYQMWQLGFQLSFLVTWGLLVYVPLFMSVPFPRKEWIRSALAVTTAAQLVSFPVLIYWFHLSSPLSWLVNLLLVPILSLIVLPIGYVVILLSYLHPALLVLPAAAIEYLLSWLHGLLAIIGEWHVPFTHWRHPAWWWMLGYGVLLVAVPIFWQRGYHRNRDKIGYCAILLLLIALAKNPFADAGEVRITFLDVGQGDSAVVEIGNRLVYVIDSGGTPAFAKEQWKMRRDPFEVGKDTVLPFLRSRGIERIDRLVMTHGDYDHIGGFGGVLPHMETAAALVNGKEPGHTELQLHTELRRKKIPIVTGQTGQSWQDGPHVRWTWLSPGFDRSVENNDASIVLLLEAYGKRILFTGDMGEEVEQRLAKEGLLSPIDVLKVGHHGSKTGTSELLLDRTRPTLAIISVGQKNRYGHPAPEILARLKARGIHTIRTDQSGAVTLRIDQTGLIWDVQLHSPDMQK